MAYKRVATGPEGPVQDSCAYSPGDTTFFGIDGRAKRIFDLCLTVPALIFIAPLLIVIACLIKLDDGGPVFFSQERVGRHGKTFRMIKFRSMRIGADALFQKHLAENPAARREWEKYQKLKHDPRITRIGGFLRRSSIDELPQLLNIVFGNMSVVGQRPILPVQRDAYGGHIVHYERARPGLTGLWQVSGRNALSFEDRARLGTDYAENWSLSGDIWLIFKTVPIVLKAEEAF
ncbi:MAG: sugar transferase [Pseudomonadota bacterium]